LQLRLVRKDDFHDRQGYAPSRVTKLHQHPRGRVLVARLVAGRRCVFKATPVELVHHNSPRRNAMPNKRANVKNEKQYEALKDKGMSKERAARISNSSGSRGGKKSHSSSSRSSSSQGGTTAQKKAAGRKGGKAAARK